MTELAEPTAPRQPDEGFMASVSKAMLRRLLVTLSATAATAATAYLTRKAVQLWEEEFEPKIRERGGGEAVARDALAKASELFESASSTIVEAEPIAAVTEKVGAVAGSGSPDASAASDPDREAERRERRKRREQRQRALKTSGST
jgi:hypothetical protein